MVTWPWVGPAVTVTVVASMSSFGSVSLASRSITTVPSSGTVAVSWAGAGGAAGRAVTVIATSAEAH